MEDMQVTCTATLSAGRAADRSRLLMAVWCYNPEKKKNTSSQRKGLACECPTLWALALQVFFIYSSVLSIWFTNNKVISLSRLCKCVQWLWKKPHPCRWARLSSSPAGGPPGHSCALPAWASAGTAARRTAGESRPPALRVQPPGWCTGTCGSPSRPGRETLGTTVPASIRAAGGRVKFHITGTFFLFHRKDTKHTQKKHTERVTGFIRISPPDLTGSDVRL